MSDDLLINTWQDLAKKTQPKIRLFVKNNNKISLIINQELEIANNDFEYLTKVMRQKVGNQIIVFDGSSGEFIGQITEINKKTLIIKLQQKIDELKKCPNITLAFAMVKNVRLDYIASKATELGVSNFQPLLTHRTIVDKINLDRFTANVKEAVEQCNRNDFPQIFPLIKLDKYLLNNSNNKILIFGDESGNGESASKALPKITLQNNQEIVLIIGPEGGFSSEEFLKLRQLKNSFALNFGPRILRADTAIICGLTLIQEFLGDFKDKVNFL